jgi:hypothetical protein
MSGVIPLLPLYAFVVWTGTSLPLTKFVIGSQYIVYSRNKKQRQNQLWVSVIGGNLPVEISITVQQRDRTTCRYVPPLFTSRVTRSLRDILQSLFAIIIISNIY